jgi:endonuclease YncB( thermonuclease family)
MRRRSAAVQWAAIIVLLVMVVAVNRLFPEYADVETSETRDGNYRAKDGDSFTLGKAEIRLHGIDAPELHQNCRDGGRDIKCGNMARDTLSKLMRGQKITCKTIERDRYGRHVSVCRNGDLNINREMVRLGWAMAYRKHSRDYIAAENEARQARRGIWAMQFESPQDYRNKSRAAEGGLVQFMDE